jgi:hypothetical protein
MKHTLFAILFLAWPSVSHNDEDTITNYTEITKEEWMSEFSL